MLTGLQVPAPVQVTSHCLTTPSRAAWNIHDREMVSTNLSQDLVTVCPAQVLLFSTCHKGRLWLEVLLVWVVQIHRPTLWLGEDYLIASEGHVHSFPGAALAAVRGEDYGLQERGASGWLTLVSVRVTDWEWCWTGGDLVTTVVRPTAWLALTLLTVLTVDSLTPLVSTTLSTQSNITLLVSLTTNLTPHHGGLVPGPVLALHHLPARPSVVRTSVRVPFDDRLPGDSWHGGGDHPGLGLQVRPRVQIEQELVLFVVDGLVGDLRDYLGVEPDVVRFERADKPAGLQSHSIATLLTLKRITSRGAWLGGRRCGWRWWQCSRSSGWTVCCCG